jgi:hypothetical protein
MGVEGHVSLRPRLPRGQCFAGSSNNSSLTWLTPEWISPIFRATR